MKSRARDAIDTFARGGCIMAANIEVNSAVRAPLDNLVIEKPDAFAIRASVFDSAALTRLKGRSDLFGCFSHNALKLSENR